MAFVRADIKIPEMSRTIGCTLYFPNKTSLRGVLWLLHGHSNNASDWMYMSSAPRYADENGYVLVCPSVDNSFYHNMAGGTHFYSLVTELLPAQLNKIFQLPTGRENTFIAGLSMGGYGAMRLGLSQPGRFAAIGSFSGALDIHATMELSMENEVMRREAYGVMGPELHIPQEADPIWLAKQTAKQPKEKQPGIFITVGHDDFLYEQNQRFVAEGRAAGLGIEYRQWPGIHEWNFWDRSLAEFIGWLQKDSYGADKTAAWAAANREVR